MLRASDLTQKEVINITDGKRVGLIADLEVDLNKGKINAIIIPSAGRFLGIFGKEFDYEISWDQIKKIGEDVILVEMKSTVEPSRYQEEVPYKAAIYKPEFIKKDHGDEE